VIIHLIKEVVATLFCQLSHIHIHLHKQHIWIQQKNESLLNNIYVLPHRTSLLLSTTPCFFLGAPPQAVLRSHAVPPSSAPAATYRNLGAGQRRHWLRATLPPICVVPEHRSAATSRVLSCSCASCAASLASRARGDGPTMGHAPGTRGDASHASLRLLSMPC
jgi:hypothetical protein